MAGNRIDMIERAAARLRRDAPAQKPIIDQNTAPNIVSLPPAASPAVTSAPASPSYQTAPPAASAYQAAPTPTMAVAPAAGPVKAGVKHSRTVVLDTARLTLAGTVDWTSDRTPVMEELRLIKRRLLRRAFDCDRVQNPRSHLVMITSAKPREGKTFAAMNIAISISLEEDYNVVLVDADIRRQALRQNLGLEASQGFVDLLLNPNLDMADVLRDLINDMAQRYDDRIIIFDTAPCLVSSDAATLAAHVGQVVFIVEAEQTQQHEIIAALNLISACPEISLVLNKAQPLATTSYGGYGAY